MEPTDDEETATAPKGSNRAELLALFLLLLRQTREKLILAVTVYLSGSITLTTLSDRLVTALGDAHTQATVIGRQLAGVSHAKDAQDEAFAASILAEQEEYLAGLLQDIEGGRYEKSDAQDTSASADAVPKALAARMLLYVLALRGTANEAWGLAQDPTQLIEWVLGGTEHCESCIALAEGSPYTLATLPTWPGRGDTECLAHCACDTRIVNGPESVPFPADL